jgi:hypothetical protein
MLQFSDCTSSLQIKKSNIAETLLLFHKEHHPEDRVDPARYKGLTMAMQRDLKDYLIINIRGFGSGKLLISSWHFFILMPHERAYLFASESCV